jgi:hypothetical protein
MPSSEPEVQAKHNEAEGGQPKVKKQRPAKTEGYRKRGPPRPHRKLSNEILSGRIEKLKKRIDRAKGQLEDAERHIDGYNKEASYREKEAAACPVS